MARKSRKNIEVVEQPAGRRQVFNVGAYVRLSAVDKKQKGDSIENQVRPQNWNYIPIAGLSRFHLEQVVGKSIKWHKATTYYSLTYPKWET